MFNFREQADLHLASLARTEAIVEERQAFSDIDVGLFWDRARTAGANASRRNGQRSIIQGVLCNRP